MKINQISPSPHKKYWKIVHWSFYSTNQSGFNKSRYKNFLSQQKYILKTLGTNIIYSPISPTLLGYINEFEDNNQPTT